MNLSEIWTVAIVALTEDEYDINKMSKSRKNKNKMKIQSNRKQIKRIAGVDRGAV